MLGSSAALVTLGRKYRPHLALVELHCRIDWCRGKSVFLELAVLFLFCSEQRRDNSVGECRGLKLTLLWRLLVYPVLSLVHFPKLSPRSSLTSCQDFVFVLLRPRVHKHYVFLMQQPRYIPESSSTQLEENGAC